MGCLNPLVGYLAGNGGFTYSVKESPTQTPLVVPCGKCLGCLEDKKKGDAAMIVLESKMHSANCVGTLTYDDDHLPEHGSARLDHASAWIKRVRSRISPVRVRFYVASEYGGQTLRAHFHFGLFGYQFPKDRMVRWNDEHNYGDYHSDLLQETWGKGLAEFTDLNQFSARYLAGYVTKKAGGGLPAEFYDSVDPATGERIRREREGNRQSRRPGLGRGWADAYQGDWYRTDFLMIGGQKVPVPRRLRNLRKGKFLLPGSDVESDFDDFDVMAERRREYSLDPLRVLDSQPDRLLVRSESLELRLKGQKRDRF